MTRPRRATLHTLGLLAAGLLLAAFLIAGGVHNTTGASLAPAWQIVGIAPKTLDRLLGRLLPVGAVDEARLGEELAARYRKGSDPEDPDHRHVNDLLKRLTAAARRPFTYRAFVVEGGGVNAMALPGGVVLVTRGLLRTLGSEAELAAVLAHEVGHIEQGHCFDGVKFQLLARKIDQATLGRIVDLSLGILTRHSFSKTQEHEADAFAFTRLEHSIYDPRGLTLAFSSFARHNPSVEVRTRVQPWRDYFDSHPPLPIRIATWRDRARAWWLGHPEERRFVGVGDLSDRAARRDDPKRTDGWIGHDQAVLEP